MLQGRSSTKACLETESYPQPEDDNILAMRGAFLAGFPPFYESSLSHGDLRATTCTEPLNPAVGMELQMTPWSVLSMLLTRSVFMASSADTKKPPLPWERKTATGQCAVYGWL